MTQSRRPGPQLHLCSQLLYILFTPPWRQSTMRPASPTLATAVSKSVCLRSIEGKCWPESPLGRSGSNFERDSTHIGHPVGKGESRTHSRRGSVRLLLGEARRRGMGCPGHEGGRTDHGDHSDTKIGLPKYEKVDFMLAARGSRWRCPQ